MNFRVPVAVSTLLCILVLASAVQAGDPKNEDRFAATRFKEGIEFARTWKWEDARLAFMQAYAVRNTPDILWNLAVADLQSDHLLDALRHFREYQKKPRGKEPPDRGKHLEESIRRAERAVGHLSLEADRRATVKLDGQRVAWPSDENVIDVVPGEHDIEFLLDDRREAQKVRALAGTVTTVASTLHEPAVIVPSPAAAVAPDSTAAPALGQSETVAPPTSVGWSARTWTLIGGGGLALAAAGVGVYAVVRAGSLDHDASDLSLQLHRNGSGPCPQDPRCRDLNDKYRARDGAGQLAVGAFVAAGAVGAATAATALLWPSHESGRGGAPMSLLPAVQPGYVGFQLVRSFQ